jgi:starvation-inducible DNA-binding protein
MIAEFRDENLQLCRSLREIHEVCENYRNVAITSLLENWIEETEQRIWFLYEVSRRS